MPKAILEKESINALIDSGSIVIAGGGGGIPIYEEDKWYRAIDAVIDKDWVSVMIAADSSCDSLVILTGVEKVAVHFNQPDERWLDELTISEAQKYIEAGEFPEGSMLPKIKAAIEFTKSGPGRKTLITSLYKLPEGLDGKTGTWIVND
jgi:carbamate kinase